MYLIDKTVNKKKHFQLFLKSKEMRKFLKLSLSLLIFIFACLYFSIVYLRGHTPSYALQKVLFFLVFYTVLLLLLFFIKLCWDFSFFDKNVYIQDGRIINWQGKIITEKDIKSILFIGNNSMDIFYQTESDFFVKRIRFEHHQPEILKSIAKTIDLKRRIPIFKKETFLDHVSTLTQNL